jgi:hypothetical protein
MDVRCSFDDEKITLEGFLQLGLFYHLMVSLNYYAVIVQVAIPLERINAVAYLLKIVRLGV